MGCLSRVCEIYVKRKASSNILPHDCNFLPALFFFFVQSDDEKRLIFIVSLLGRLNVPCYERISKLSIQQPPTTKRTNLFSFLHCIITCVHLESHKGANRIVNKPVYVFLSFLVEKYHSTYFACKITNNVSKWSPWASPECFCRFSSYPAKI